MPEERKTVLPGDQNGITVTQAAAFSAGARTRYCRQLRHAGGKAYYTDFAKMAVYDSLLRRNAAGSRKAWLHEGPFRALFRAKGRRPVVVLFKVREINEVLEELRAAVSDGRIRPFLRLVEEGLTYSDVLLMLKWYKVLPR